jgi:hypothetical protein
MDTDKNLTNKFYNLYKVKNNNNKMKNIINNNKHFMNNKYTLKL